MLDFSKERIDQFVELSDEDPTFHFTFVKGPQKLETRPENVTPGPKKVPDIKRCLGLSLLKAVATIALVFYGKKSSTIFGHISNLKELYIVRQ